MLLRLSVGVGEGRIQSCTFMTLNYGKRKHIDIDTDIKCKYIPQGNKQNC